MTSVLLFDFGGTLDADGEAWKERFFRLFRAEGMEAGPDEFHPVFYREDEALVGAVPKDLSLRQTAERIAEGVAGGLGLGRERAARVAGRFIDDSMETLRSRERLLDTLSHRYRLGVVSNFYGNLARVLYDSGLSRLFSVCVDSVDAGCVKPDPRIFRAALDPLGVSPAEAVFIGDSLPRDMAGARRLGMPHIWVNPSFEGGSKGPGCCPGDRVIRTLEELPDVLEQEPALDAGIRQGGILAAGEGSRLKRDGLSQSKPLVPVAGTRLIERVLQNFEAAGIGPVTVIFNEDETDCVSYVSSEATRFQGLDLTVLVKTTPSSFASFVEVTRGLGPGRALISTVDAVLLPEDFLEFVRRATMMPSEATVLAVTSLVADEKPLWVSLGEEGRVTALGGSQGDSVSVTAGIYVVPERVGRLARERAFDRLRDFLRWLVEQGEDVRGVSIPRVVDVDRAEDLALAEDLVNEARVAR